MPKKKTKDKKIERIIKFITDGEIDKALELADINDVEDLFNIGILFGKCEIHNVAEKIFDRVVQLNPNFAEAWYNKGVALENLGRYDEAVKCFDKAIEINPNFAEAYGNLGITLLNLHKYDKAIHPLRKAEELFSKRGAKEDANKAHKYTLLATNASKLMSKLKPLDEQFISCLNSRSLIELKEKSSKISESIKSIIKEFEKIELPEDAKRLLISKEICFTALSDALKFKKVDLNKLEEEKRIFEKWNLDSFIMAINSLGIFIRVLRKYKNFEEIPNNVEQALLQMLGSLSILDGILTGKISDKIEVEPYPAKPIGIEKKPEINYIRIPNIEIKKDCLRVCLVQLDFRITETFPYQLKNKDDVKKKILKALEVAKKKGVNIICFPELSFAEEFISEVKKYKDIIIIGGSYYDENNYNICPVIIDGEVYPVYKIHPSPYLESEIAPGKGMKSGKDIKIFGTEDGKIRFGVLICLDYLEESYHLYHYQIKGKKGINFIFNPSFNRDPKRFQRRANSDCENYHVDIIQTNVKEFGGTCIIGREHRDVIKRLIGECYRPNDDITYKLCEAGDEMMIIADLRLSGVEVPTSVRACPRIKIIGRYIYKDGYWQKLT